MFSAAFERCFKAAFASFFAELIISRFDMTGTFMASRNRGQPKPKLSHLSRAAPTSEDKDKWRDGFSALHPIATAVWGAAMVEHELDDLIRNRMKIRDESTWSELVESGGPLSSFSSKILIGYSLGIYGADIRHNLDIIRNIRNIFAHAKQSVSFDHNLVVKELKNIKVHKETGI